MASKCMFCIKCWQDHHKMAEYRCNCQNCDGSQENTYNAGALENWNKFYTSQPARTGYDCLIMMSGGKDSFYALSKIVRTTGLKPLCYTFEHPCLNNASKSNINKINKLFQVDWISYKTNDRLLKEIFADFYREKEKFNLYCTHKIACGFCTAFLILTAFKYAYQLHIPYVVYGADPEQLQVIPLDFNFFAGVIKNMEIGEKFFKIYDEDIFNLIIKKQDQQKWPLLISPFAAGGNEYRSENIIKDLRAQKADYVALNPEETRCSLHTIIKLKTLDHDKCFYHVFESFFNLDFLHPAHADKKKVLDRYRVLYKKFAGGPPVTETDKTELQAVLQELYKDHQFSNTWELEYNNIVTLHDNIQAWNLADYV